MPKVGGILQAISIKWVGKRSCLIKTSNNLFSYGVSQYDKNLFIYLLYIIYLCIYLFVIYLFLFEVSLYAEVSSFSNTGNPFSWSLSISWYTTLLLNIQRMGQQVNCPLIKELNITFLLKAVINGTNLIKALNFSLAVFIINFV